MMYCPHCMVENREEAQVCQSCGKTIYVNNNEHELPIGTILSDRYYVGKSLRQGGFGITYVGKDIKPGMNKKIAIKEYFPTGIVTRMSRFSQDVSVTAKDEASTYDKEKQRFVEEAGILSRFAGERNIVSITDVISEHNTVYLIMEFLDGIDLDEYIHNQPKISFSEAYKMIQPIILTLSRIHEQGLIHRDITLSNIKVLQDGTAVLLDFGAAREYSTSDEKSMSVILKPGYAPVEQYNSHGMQGPASDVYAICATLYKMITGVTPANALDRMVNDTVKKPSELGADISPEEEAALMAGMAVLPKDRIASMNDLNSQILGLTIPLFNESAVLPLDKLPETPRPPKDEPPKEHLPIEEPKKGFPVKTKLLGSIVAAVAVLAVACVFLWQRGNQNNTETAESLTDIPTNLSTYVAPSSLPDDAREPVFELGNKLYRLPCPLSEFVDDGWVFSEKTIENIDGKSIGDNGLKMTKDGYEINPWVMNFEDHESPVENCAVYSISFQTDYGSWDMTGEYLKFSGGLTIDSSLEDAVSLSQEFYKAEERTHTSYEYRSGDQSVLIRYDWGGQMEGYMPYLNVKMENESWDY